MKNLAFALILACNIGYAQEKGGTNAMPPAKPIAPATATVTATPPITPVTTTTTTAANNVSPNAPVIEFEKTTHDFGTMKKGSLVMYKFKYKNAGKEPLLIYNCKAGCGCTKTECSKEPLKPGKSDYIEVHYDSMRVGTFAKEIMIASNSKTGVLHLIIKGNIVGETEGSDLKKEEEQAVPAGKTQ